VAVLHPHYGTVVQRDTHVDRVLEGTEIGICVDVGHLMVGGADPLAVTKSALNRVRHVHLKDVDADLAARVQRGEIGYRDAVAAGLYRPLGSGDVDIAKVVRLLESAGYAGWYVLEQDMVLERVPADGEGPVVDAAASVRFLTDLSVT
jgi:inosose dehydratase